MLANLLTVLLVGGGTWFYVRHWRAARASSAPPLVPREGAVVLACSVTLGGFSDNGSRRDRVVLTPDVLHVELRAGLRGSFPRGSVTALDARPLLGHLLVDVQHTGEGVTAPDGPVQLSGKRREAEPFLDRAAELGWPVVRR